LGTRVESASNTRTSPRIEEVKHGIPHRASVLTWLPRRPQPVLLALAAPALEVPNPPAPAPRRPRRRIRIAALVLALPLGLVATDVGLGLLWLDTEAYDGPPVPPFTIRDNPRLAEWFEWQEHLRSNAGPGGYRSNYDRELGWTSHPRPASRKTQKYLAAINSIGARSTREYEPEVPEGKLRLLCFGDSFTYGSEAEDGEEWCAQLETLAPDVEAVNFGHPGYGLDQALLCYRRKREELEADVVVIGIQVEALPRVVTRCRSIEFPLAAMLCVKPRFLLVDDELQLVPLPFPDAEALYQCAKAGELPATLAEHEYWSGDEPLFSFSNFARLRAAYAAQERRSYPRLWEARREEPYRVLTEVLWTFREEAFEHGAKEVLVMIFPNHRDLGFRGPRGVRFLRFFRADLDERGVEVLDFDVIFERRMRRGRKSLFLRNHFNPKANRRVAEILLDWVRAHPVLGAAGGDGE